MWIIFFFWSLFCLHACCDFCVCFCSNVYSCILCSCMLVSLFVHFFCVSFYLFCVRFLFWHFYLRFFSLSLFIFFHFVWSTRAAAHCSNSVWFHVCFFLISFLFFPAISITSFYSSSLARAFVIRLLFVSCVYLGIFPRLFLCLLFLLLRLLSFTSTMCVWSTASVQTLCLRPVQSSSLDGCCFYHLNLCPFHSSHSACFRAFPCFFGTVLSHHQAYLSAQLYCAVMSHLIAFELLACQALVLCGISVMWFFFYSALCLSFSFHSLNPASYFSFWHQSLALS